MKEIITEYGKAILFFTIGGLIIMIVAWLFVWGKKEIASDVYAKEDNINYSSDIELKEIINKDLELRVVNNIQTNTNYHLRDIITGADYIDIVKVENPEMVSVTEDNITFLSSGVVNLYVNARLNTGESTRAWLSVGVDG